MVNWSSLAAAEATGGLGSTATGNQLAAIAPTLGQNWLSGQMNNYNNLANTDNYNQQYNVNVGKSQRQQSQPTQVSQPAASSNFSSLWGD